MGYSIEEKVLSTNGRINVEFHMNEFEWRLFAPKQSEELTTPNGLKVRVVDTSYYKGSNFGIVRLVRIS